jgi:ABC-type Mn2+/Zn2+ transport system permease subunit
VTPAAAAKTVSANLSRYFKLSAIFGAISAVSGILLSNYFNIVPGPLVVISGITIFMVAVIVRWRLKLAS